MQPGQARLAIDYGAACTQAVVAWPDGRWVPLSFDGGPVLSNAAHVDASGRIVVGAAAWAQASTDPGGFVVSPLRAGFTTVPVSGVDVQVSDLVVAGLSVVATHAAQVVGAPVEDVRMVVPAQWGPRRRTWLRQAAFRAGLGQPRLVEAPVAAADRFLAGGMHLQVGEFLLVCDLGAGCEVSVVRRGPAGFELLSTLADPDAAGACVDDLLAAGLPGAGLVDAVGRWPLAASVQAAKHALAVQPAVTVPLPAPAPPVVLNQALLAEAARPVLERAGELAAQAVANAELTVTQLAGAYCVGGTAALPGAAEVIGQKLGITPQVVVQPAFTAVLGAAEAGGPSTTAADLPDPAPPTPPLRRLLGLALAGSASLALFAHMVSSATFHNGTPDFPRPFYYVLASWGELTTAALFAVIACLQAGTYIGAALRPAAAHGTGPDGSRIASGIAVAATAGIAVGGLYAVTAAVYLGVGVAGPLRWAVLPSLPVAGLAAGIAWIAGRRHRTPAHGWDALLAFPTGSVLAAATGTFLVAVWANGPIPAVLNGWADAVGRVGGLLIGVGAACALARTPTLRLLAGIPLGFFGLIIVSARADKILAVVYALAAALWWGHRLWVYAHPPAPTPGPAQ